MAQHERAIRITVLGPIGLVVDGHPIPGGSLQQRVVLAVLALRARQHVPMEALVQELWGDGHPPATARRTVQTYVSRLRRILGDRLATVADGYRLDLPPGAVDAEAFSGAVTRAGELAPVDPVLAARILDEALDRWAGPALADVDGAVLQAARAHLEGLRSDAEAHRVALACELGEPGATARAQAHAAAHPLREHAHVLLMRALYRDGRQAEALEAFGAVRKRLIRELGVEPGPALRQAQLDVLAERCPALPDGPSSAGTRPPAEGPAAGHLPAPLTPVVGREADLVAVRRLVEDRRLTSLVGPGGCGKTRLAIEVARSTWRPAWLVRLDEVDGAAMIPHAIADAVGVAERPGIAVHDQVAAVLRSSPGLLVLDNCEHVATAVARLASDLLERCPALRILATSRQRLGLPAEHLWPVQPLAVPPPEARAVEEIGGYPAVELLRQRAVAVVPAFRVDPGTAADVAALCRVLDGVPLALELAAPGLRTMSIRQLCRQLERGPDVLAGGSPAAPARHRGARAAIGWSHGLLDQLSQTVFARLSAFPATFDLAAAEAICTGDGVDVAQVGRAVAELVDASLLQPVHDVDPPRYRMLQVVRAFAAAELSSRPEGAAVRCRHMRHFATVALRHGPAVRGDDADRARAVLDGWHADLNACLASAVDVDPPLGTRVAAALQWWWLRYDGVEEGLTWLRLLGRSADRLPDADRAQLVGQTAFFAWTKRDPDASEADAAEALRLARLVGHRELEADALAVLAYAALHRGALEVAAARWADALASVRPTGNVPDIVMSLNFSSITARRLGRCREAAAFAEAALAAAERTGDRWDQALASWVAHRAAAGSDHGAATRHLADAIAAWSALGHLGGLARGLEGVASLAVRAGQHRRAARLLGAADAVPRGGISALDAVEAVDPDEQLALLRRELSADGELAGAHAEGRAMPVDVAAASAVAAAAAGVPAAG